MLLLNGKCSKICYVSKNFAFLLHEYNNERFKISMIILTCFKFRHTDKLCCKCRKALIFKARCFYGDIR